MLHSNASDCAGTSEIVKPLPRLKDAALIAVDVILDNLIIMILMLIITKCNSQANTPLHIDCQFALK